MADRHPDADAHLEIARQAAAEAAAGAIEEDDDDLKAADVAFIMAKVREYVDSLTLVGHEGVVADGSWNQAEGTVDVILGDTFSCFTDQGDQPIVLYNVPVSRPDPGDQTGFGGGERVVLQRTQSGWIAKPHCGPDDSPGAPSGERWFTGKKLYKFASIGGWTLQIDDTGKATTLSSPDGLVFKLDDNAALASIVGATDLGATGLDTTLDAVITKRDLDDALSRQSTQLKTDLGTWAAAHLAGGTGAVGPTTLNAVTSTGSSKVRAAQ